MKMVQLACVAAAVVVLSGASVWEGAAAIAPGGELPDSGYYVATNSFPRNTVVDITNLENGKSIRVIVAASIETPGLLAVLSEHAAKIIGMRNGSTGRIRMSQPADPIAFSRFTEGMAAYREPDSTAAIPITEETAYAPAPSLETSPFIGASGPGTVSPVPPASGRAALAVPQQAVPGRTGSAAPQAQSAPDNTSASGYVLEPEWLEFPYGKIVDLPNAIAAAPDNYRRNPAATNGNEPEPGNGAAGQTKAPKAANEDYILVPAEERPPQTYREPTGSTGAAPASGAPPRPETGLSPVSPARSAAAEPPLPIPLVGELERGKYYVQIGAFSHPGLVESAVNRIGASYPLAVQSAQSGGKQIYRVLLGPLNLGESGAVLQQVKSLGYQDALVRGPQ
jgi:hypothetical protein